MSTVDVPHTPDDAGSAKPKRRKPRDRPLLIVITCEGKGKSTSAFGMLLRSWARGYRCGVFQASDLHPHWAATPNVARRLVAMAASACDVPA